MKYKNKSKQMVPLIMNSVHAAMCAASTEHEGKENNINIPILTLEIVSDST